MVHRPPPLEKGRLRQADRITQLIPAPPGHRLIVLTDTAPHWWAIPVVALALVETVHGVNVEHGYKVYDDERMTRVVSLVGLDEIHQADDVAHGWWIAGPTEPDPTEAEATAEWARRQEWRRRDVA